MKIKRGTALVANSGQMVVNIMDSGLKVRQRDMGE